MTVALACSDGTGPGSSPKFGLAFRIDNPALARSSASTAAVMNGTVPVVTVTASGLRIARDTDVIVVTKAQLVVRDVKLRRTGESCTDDDESNLLAGGGSSDSARDGNRDGRKDGDDKDECPPLKLGPFLVTLPVTGTDASMIAVDVPAGTFASVHFHLRPATGSRSDELLFREANPDFRDISIRLEGTFDGTPFIFVADVSAFIDVPLTEPLIIGADGGTVTVAIDLGTWFARPTTGLFAPANANVPGAVRSQVLQNIRMAFRAFRDRDHDGHKD